EQPDVIERFQHGLRDAHSVGDDPLDYRSWRDRNIENVAAMHVFDWPEVRPRAVNAARADHRDFTFEIEERLENGLLPAEGAPGSECIRVVRDAHLTLAVIA